MVGEAEDGESLILLIRKLKPNVLLFEIEIRKCSRLEVLNSISEIEPDMRSIILAAEIENRDIVKALLFGARGVMRKN
jgi:DNA-binding NarL/FixJ family response regulator